MRAATCCMGDRESRKSELTVRSMDLPAAALSPVSTPLSLHARLLSHHRHKQHNDAWRCCSATACRWVAAVNRLAAGAGSQSGAGGRAAVLQPQAKWRGGPHLHARQLPHPQRVGLPSWRRTPLCLICDEACKCKNFELHAISPSAPGVMLSPGTH